MSDSIWIVLVAVMILISCSAGGRNLREVAPSETAKATAPAPAVRGKVNALALLVGIDKYKHFPDLRGAVNDVKNIKRLLVDSFNFPDDEEHIKVLTNEQATRSAIIEGVRRHLAARATPNSVVVFHYSGHGSRLLDTSGDESDGYDETIVPHDSGRAPHPNREITDDELNALLGSLTERTPNVTFIFDSCNSGTAIRGSGLARTVEPDDRPPPQRDQRLIGNMRSRRDDRSDLRPRGSRYVLISGAAAQEESYELAMGGQTYGAMTWYLANQIRQAGADVTYRDIMEIVEAKVATKYPNQHPQLEGTGRDQRVFSARSSDTLPYVLVSPNSNSSVTLSAGQVHGVSVGSIYDVFPPGTREFGVGQSPIARVEVVGVDPTTAEASVMQGGGIEPVSRAVEKMHKYPDAVIRVFLKDVNASTVLQKIKSELLDFKHIVPVQKASGYDLLLREADGSIITEGGDPTEISPRVPVTATNAVSRVVNQVTQWAKWFNIFNIKNNNPDLAIAFDIDTPAADAVLLEGAKFTITIKNNSGQRLYLALLDLSTDGQIQLVFPQSGEEEFVAPGYTWRKRLQTYLQEGQGSVRDILKIIATTKPTDYSFLEQPPIRGVRTLSKSKGRSRNPLEELLSNAVAGTTRGVQLVEVGHWVTIERVIEVQRSGSP